MGEQISYLSRRSLEYNLGPEIVGFHGTGIRGYTSLQLDRVPGQRVLHSEHSQSRLNDIYFYGRKVGFTEPKYAEISYWLLDDETIIEDAISYAQKAARKDVLLSLLPLEDGVDDHIAFTLMEGTLQKQMQLFQAIAPHVKFLSESSLDTVLWTAEEAAKDIISAFYQMVSRNCTLDQINSAILRAQKQSGYLLLLNERIKRKFTIEMDETDNGALKINCPNGLSAQYIHAVVKL